MSNKVKCEFCDEDTHKRSEYDDDNFDIEINEDNELEIANYLYYEGYHVTSRIKINFCPFCGRNLKTQI